ncbi:MAG: CopG family transcriptional regulator [Candidatus Micrarchaeota archaeon]
MGLAGEQINIRLTKEQREIVKMLVGVMGGTEAEVIRSIFLAWLSDKGVLSDVIKRRWVDKHAKDSS